MGTILGNTTASATKYINFEDVLCAISQKATIINTLHKNKQSCLIHGTIPADDEETYINHLLENSASDAVQHIIIVIYGENAGDASVEKKYNQLRSLGFARVYIYRGGLFEWILLQNIYGCEKIPTTAPEKDILKYVGTHRISH